MISDIFCGRILTLYKLDKFGGADMSGACEICNKGAMHGNKVSFSNRTSRRAWKPNIQKVRAVIDGTPRRINACTRCIKSGRVVKSI